MLKLLRSLFLVLAVLFRMILVRRKYLLMPLVAIIMLLIGLSYNNKTDNNKTDNIYPLNIDEKIISDTLGMKFRGFPSISPDGRYIAYNNIILEGREIKDIKICLYDKQENRLIDLPGIESTGWDLSPSVSERGHYIAFQSNREGKHTWNIYLYDTWKKCLVDLPGLKSFMPDMNPTISGDGNFITFASVRTARLEVYIYDRNKRKVLPIPSF